MVRELFQEMGCCLNCLGGVPGLKNVTAVTLLAGYVERGELKPYVQEYFPLDGVARAFNASAAGGVIGAYFLLHERHIGAILIELCRIAGKLGIVVNNDD